MSSKCSSNSEADASELQENLEQKYPRYYMHSAFKFHRKRFYVFLQAKNSQTLTSYLTSKKWSKICRRYEYCMKPPLDDVT